MFVVCRACQHAAGSLGSQELTKAFKGAYKTIEDYQCRLRTIAQLRGLHKLGTATCGVSCICPPLSKGFVSHAGATGDRSLCPDDRGKIRLNGCMGASKLAWNLSQRALPLLL